MNKGLIVGIAATAVIVIGGVFLFAKGGSNQSENKISDAILAPSDAEKTSGIVNGVYQPALNNTKLTLVEFGDYQCPACGVYNPLVKQILTDFAGKLNFVFRDFAFIGSESVRASEASYCAADQNKYWEFHEYLYSHQNGENKGTFSDDNLKVIAKKLDLNTKIFNDCFDSKKYQSKVENGANDARLAKVDSTPSFFINGVKINNPGSYEAFKKLISDALNNLPAPSGNTTSAYHIHFDLKVYLNGKPVDFSLAKYQESKDNPLDPNIHFHDGNGKVVHVHKEGVTLKELFDSFKLSIPAGATAYVNGKKAENILTYVPQDLDQILIGSSDLSSVSGDACIYSLKCPERGTPPPEDCVGGLGTGCTD